MNRCLMPHRVTLWTNGDGDIDIDYGHVLSDGYGIPAVVIGCPMERQCKKYAGRDEYGNKVKGIGFDDRIDCKFFEGFGFGQEIYCTYEK